MVLIKVGVLLCLLLLCYQDFTKREVFVGFFPLLLLGSGYLFYQHTLPELFIINVLFNIIFVTILLVVVWLYSKLKMKQPMSSVFGLGDVFMFFIISVSFATVSFIVVFIFSLIFSLLLYQFIQKRLAEKTVPLAGFMSLFFAITYVAFWMHWIDDLYVL